MSICKTRALMKYNPCSGPDVADSKLECNRVAWMQHNEQVLGLCPKHCTCHWQKTQQVRAQEVNSVQSWVLCASLVAPKWSKTSVLGSPLLLGYAPRGHATRCFLEGGLEGYFQTAIRRRFFVTESDPLHVWPGCEEKEFTFLLACWTVALLVYSA